MKTSSSAFTVRFDGPAVQGHEIDVRLMTPALLAVAELIEQANEAVNGKRAQVKLKVQAHSGGSFVIAAVARQDVLDRAVEFLMGNPVQAVAVLLGLLGISLRDAVPGVLQLLQMLRGAAPDKVREIDDNLAEIHTPAGTYTLPRKTLELYQSTRIRHVCRDLGRAMQDTGIETIEFTTPGDSPVLLNRSSAEAFDLAFHADQETLNTERETFVNPVTIGFTDGYKWRVREGESTFTADVSDADFITRLLRENIRVGANDIFHVRLSQVSVRVGDELKTSRVITKVLRHIAAPVQDEMPLPPAPDQHPAQRADAP